MPNNKPGRNAGPMAQMGMSAPRAPRQPRQQKPRRKGKPGRRARIGITRPRARMVGAMQLAHSLCSVLDPFCPHAVGARLWGDGGIQTVALSAHQVITLATDDVNANAFFFYPDWNRGWGVAEAVSGTLTFPLLSQFTFGSGTASSLCIEGRVVTAGFIIRNISPAMNVEGTYYVVPLPRYTATDTLSAPPALYDQRAEVVPATKSGETAVVSFRRGYGALDFHAALDGTGVQPDYQPWIVWFPPTTTAQTYQIEMFVHIEGLVSLANQHLAAIGANGGKKALPAAAGQLADSVASKAKQTASTMAGKAAESFGKQLARGATQIAATAVGAYFGGPAGATAGYTGGTLLADGAAHIIEVD